MSAEAWRWACPACGAPLAAQDSGLRCHQCDQLYACADGIYRLMTAADATHFAQFLQEYTAVRHAEGRGGDGAHYRALPFVDAPEWRIRAHSFTTLMEKVIRPFSDNRPLRILDLGAGTGWLSNRLALAGHLPLAVDLSVDGLDGLGAAVHFDTRFERAQAAFARLPLCDGQADLLIFNAALHYASDYATVLREARRVLLPGGRVVVVDTAVYTQRASGEQMVAEREAVFLQQFGFASNSLDSQNFLTFDQLDELAGAVGLAWQQEWPVSAGRRLIRRAKVALRGQREAAQFPILVGKFDR